MLYLCVIVFIIVYIINYLVLSLEPEMLGKDQQIHSFFLYTYMKTRFNFFLCFLLFFFLIFLKLLFLRGHVLNFT